MCACIQASAQNCDIEWITFPAAQPVENAAKGRPFDFATAYETSLTADNSGTLQTLDDGTTVWTLGICAEWSENLNVTIQNANLELDETICVRNPSGADAQFFSATKNIANGVAQSLPIDGDSIVIEYFSTAGSRPDFCITHVNCGFLPFGKKDASANKTGSYGDACSIEVDATCNPAVDIIKQSVCRLIINGRTYGSGVLVNNTRADGTPYVITSAHCITNNELTSCVAMFNFEVPMCQSPVVRTDCETISGATLVAFAETHDMALLRLNSAPSAESRPYWSGWSLADAHTGTFYAVHHPQGDVRKVSVAQSVEKSTYDADRTNNHLPFDEDAHWLVSEWTGGTTEGGSSGCGLWNDNERLIGNLSGGYATCSSPYNDYFWRLNSAWQTADDGFGTLAEALDPQNRGTTQVNGAFLSDAIYQQYFNIDQNDVTNCLRPDDGAGFVAGHNNYGTSAVAERFGSDGSNTEIQGVYIATYKVVKSVGQTFGISLWTDKNGRPDQKIYSMDDLKISSLTTNRMAYFGFDEPQTVSGRFHIGVEFAHGSYGTDTLAIYHSLVTDEADGTASFKVGEAWYDFSHFTSAGASGSLFIGFLGSDTAKNGMAATGKSTNVRLLKTGRTIEIAGNALEQVEVFDMAGTRQIQHNIGGAARCAIDMSGLSSGVYIVRVKSDNGTDTFKILNTGL